jgi:hypothetical protein
MQSGKHAPMLYLHLQEKNTLPKVPRNLIVHTSSSKTFPPWIRKRPLPPQRRLDDTVQDHTKQYFRLCNIKHLWHLLHVSNLMGSQTGRQFVHAVFVRHVLSCIYVRSLAGGRKCSVLSHLLDCFTQTHENIPHKIHLYKWSSWWWTHEVRNKMSKLN